MEINKPDTSNEAYRKEQERIATHMNMANDQCECILLLKKLNTIIETLSELQDDYYTHYIFNSSSLIDKWLEKEGFTEEYFSELEDRFEMLRSILFGNQISWKQFYIDMADKIMAHQHWKLEQKEEYIRKLEYEGNISNGTKI